MATLSWLNFGKPTNLVAQGSSNFEDEITIKPIIEEINNSDSKISTEVSFTGSVILNTKEPLIENTENSTTQTNNSQEENQNNQTIFIIKAADIPLNIIKSGTNSYQPNWQTIVKESLGLNTLRFQTGGEGDVWKLNMIQNPNSWYNNLENLLSIVDAAGLKCYFYTLGDEWGGMMGITDQSIPYMDINLAKSYIDKLAGDNPLNHNFISDSRIAVWSVANEANFGDPSSPNAQYYWAIEICDYIKSKGGKTTIPYPRLNNGWEQYFEELEPLLRDHVDYLETHAYNIWHLVNYFSLGNNHYDWEAWELFTKNTLLNIIENSGSFSIDQILLGEFGIWRGEGTDAGLSAHTFTDQNRIDYYTHYFNIINELGLKNICFHYAIEENSQYGNPQFCRYGMISPVPDYVHFFDLAGQSYSGSEIIKENFSQNP